MDDVVVRVETCLEHVRSWMSKNFLKLNEEKTELLFISTRAQLQKVSAPAITIGSARVEPAVTAKNLGVIFDSLLNMDAQVDAICKASYFQLHNIGRIRKYLDQQTVKTVVHSLVSSRLDYCNSVLSGVTDRNIRKLQKVQNAAARIIHKVPKMMHVTPILQRLHWLPIRQRVEYKLLLLAFKAVNGIAPEYLSSLLKRYCSVRQLRSSSQELLFVPKSKLKSFGDRSFSVKVPGLWNELPHNLKCLSSIEEFKKCLKTLLFRKSYGL